MKQTAADLLISRLIAWGVDTVFGIPGDGVNGVIEAFRKKKKEIRFIQTRHEESAAFMACGYAKFTGRLGVCLATSGPGGIHLLNGLYDAKLDGQPVLAITGMQFHDLTQTHTQQDVELDKVYMDVAVYNARVMGPAHIENVIDLAIRTALARRGVAHVTIPVDFQDMEAYSEASKRNAPHHTSNVQASPVRLPHESDLIRAADVLNDGKKVVILAGRGALDATDELISAAETLGAPVVKALLGKAAVPDDHPVTTGGIGLLGTEPSEEAMSSCDTLFMVGTSFPYLEFYPKPGKARAVQIDSDASRIGLRYPVEVGLVGDARESLRLLLPHLRQKKDRSFLEKAQSGMKKWRELMETRSSVMEKPMKPQVVARAVGRVIPENAVVTCDSGTITTWWARYIPARRGQMHSLSGNLATMACGLPYAIAAQVAHPNRPVIAFVGDGGFSMLMAEFATAVKYRLPIKVVVVKNDTLGQIKWEQMVFLGNPEYVCDLQPIDYVKVAEACGGTGFRVDDPLSCVEVINAAMETPGPVLIEAIVDGLEPPMPGKIKADQAKQFAKAMLRGEKDRGGIIPTVVKDRVRELV